MSRPPIALMVYNRPEHTRKTLEALSLNNGAGETDLFIFSDGPKFDDDKHSIQLVRDVVESFKDKFKSFNIDAKKTNIGLAESIITGVTKVVEEYGQVIVVEDDLIFSPKTLDYFKDALEFYKFNKSVFSVSGYSPSPAKFKIRDDYPYDAYFIPRMMCWGWATWSDRWCYADWGMSDFNKFICSSQRVKIYCNVIGRDSFETLKKCVAGTKDVWACRWVYTHFNQNAMCVCPKESYVNNIGLDGSGSNCGISNDKLPLLNSYPKSNKLPKYPFLDLSIFSQFMSVYNKKPSNISSGHGVKKKSLKKKIKNFFNKTKKIKLIPALFKRLSTTVDGEIVFLGTNYGGWRVIPTLISNGERVLSAGVGEDMSFDITIAKLFGVDVVLMDPTPRAIEHYKCTSKLIERGEKAPINNDKVYYAADKEILTRLSYLEYGLWNQNCKLKFYEPKVKSHVSHSIGNLHDTYEFFEAECKTLKFLSDAGYLKDCSILKLDIEGAEFSVLRDLVKLRGFRPKQLLVEFHPGNSGFEKKYRLKTLLHSFMLWMIGYRIVTFNGWDFQFVYGPSLNRNK